VLVPHAPASPAPTLTLVERQAVDDVLPALDFGSNATEEIDAAPPPLAEVIEFPELGSVQASAPVIEPVSQGPSDGGDDGDIALELEPAVEPLAPLAAHDAPGAQAWAESPAPDEIDVGGVRVSATLYAILVEEADQHVATLTHELTVLQFDAEQAPSAEMVRASHTLCGIHRTAGFPLVAAVAKSLEQCLLALQQHTGSAPGFAPAVLARAVAGLCALVSRVKARTAFTAEDQAESDGIVRELEELRQEIAAEPITHDAESVAERVAEAEDEAPSDVPDVQPLHEAAPSRPPLALVIPITSAHAAPEPAQAPRAEEAQSAAVPIEAHAADDESLADVHDEVDEQVLPIFLDEATELFPQAGEQLRAWRRAPSEVAHAQQLRRTLHTFKGSARMAGAMRLGELTHRMESRLISGDALARATPELFEALETDLDHVAFVLDALREGRSNIALPWLAQGEEQTLDVAAPVVREPAAAPPIAATPIVVPIAPHATPPQPVQPPQPSMPAAAVAAAAPSEAPDAEAASRAMLRVRADMIDRLVNEAGEVAIARARVEGELRSLKGNLLELTGSVIRLRTQVREVEIQAESQIQSRMTALQEAHGEFDPLELDRFTRFQELTRSLAEGVNDVSTVQQSLLKNLDDADAALLAQARLSREVQQQLFSIRTVPFGSLSDRLFRIMRQTAKELDKRANLEIHGAQTELDRSVLEKLVGPLEHLLRNALDHGVEPHEARVAAGKSETGEIALTVRQVGNEIAIEIADDGGGIDLEHIRQKAIANGKLAADAHATDAQLIELIFQPGFTTASRVTQISGRGIGMDVVRSEIAALGGRVEVTTQRGRGTRFMLFLPLTLAVAQAVLVRAGGRLWALPSPMVEQVQQVKPDALVHLYVNRSVEWQGRSYPFHYLPRLLGDMSHSPDSARYNPVLLLRAGQGLAAIHVDEMIGNQEVVVKNIGPQLTRVSGIAGATVLGSGEIVLIINPVQLAQRTDVQMFDPEAEERVASERVRAQATSGRPLVMVVDDSLTVRKITSRLLVREGFDVVTAKDGVDALQVLGDQMPDVILLDIEMPRMDGFEFTKTIKGDTKFSHIPIVMITSRTADKHRHRAKELGVDLYLGKPFQEEELLRNLREMLELQAQ
jgi:chemosensory pili system protein ChpA (sensor histidine kinase/response regulator)